MGGRLDATNALTPCVCAFGPIAMDHAKWLGDTLERIAEEKAGILKPGVPAFAFQQSAAALTVLQSRAAAVGAPLSVLAAPWLGAAGLEGTHQRENAAVAAAAARALLPGVSDDAVALGIAAANWPARFQRLRDGRLIVDGAHNENAAAALCAAWRDAFGEEKASVVFGAVEDKDIRAVAAAIAPVAGDWVLVKAPGSRGIPAADLTYALPPGATYRIADSVAGALSLAEGRHRRVLVAGSLYLAGEVLALQGGAAFEASAQ
ncbi:MAG: cyanophycin synthetase [Verrucomicrobiales bacterium]